MSHITIDPTVKRRIQPNKFARNGRIVSAKYQSEVAALANQLGRFRTKTYYRSPGDVTSPATDKLWRFSGHIGPLARTMVARILMAPPSNQTAATKNPRATLTVYDSSGNTIGSAVAYWGHTYGKVSLNTVDEWGLASIGINILNYQDTSFRAELRADDEARPMSCVVYETSALPDTTAVGSSGYAYVEQQYSVGQPINDQDRQDIYDLANALYKRGGPSLFTWSSATDATAYSSPQTFNLLDTQFAAANHIHGPGYLIDTRYTNRKTSTTVPVRFEVYAKMAGLGFGNGAVAVIRSDGTVMCSCIINSTTAQWYRTTANLSASLDTYYVLANGNGFDSITAYAASCYRYS